MPTLHRRRSCLNFNLEWDSSWTRSLLGFLFQNYSSPFLVPRPDQNDWLFLFMAFSFRWNRSPRNRTTRGNFFQNKQTNKNLISSYPLDNLDIAKRDSGRPAKAPTRGCSGGEWRRNQIHNIQLFMPAMFIVMFNLFYVWVTIIKFAGLLHRLESSLWWVRGKSSTSKASLRPRSWCDHFNWDE